MNPEKEKRHLLLKQMKELENQGIHCGGCSGICCTYERNSMMVTNDEALVVYDFLKTNNFWNDDFIHKLKNTVHEFRLDRDLGNGKKSFIRRSYTCPLFLEKSHGCPLPRDIKPYGCLAYNPTVPNESKGLSCFSDQELLKDQIDQNGWEDKEKMTLPQFLLKLSDQERV